MATLETAKLILKIKHLGELILKTKDLGEPILKTKNLAKSILKTKELVQNQHGKRDIGPFGEISLALIQV